MTYDYDARMRYNALMKADIASSKKETPRGEVLAEALKLVTEDRNDSYGEPTDNLGDIAKGWTLLLSHKLAPDQEITSGDVAAFNVWTKLVRRKKKSKRDNWTDTLGYGAIGYECDLFNGEIDE